MRTIIQTMETHQGVSLFHSVNHQTFRGLPNCSPRHKCYKSTQNAYLPMSRMRRRLKKAKSQKNIIKAVVINQTLGISNECIIAAAYFRNISFVV